jgi:hypothetical protein
MATDAEWSAALVKAADDVAVARLAAVYWLATWAHNPNPITEAMARLAVGDFANAAVRQRRIRDAVRWLSSLRLALASPSPRAELERLGLTEQCTAAELARAHRRAAKTAHPDAGGTHEAMRAINEDVARVKLWKGWA